MAASKGIEQLLAAFPDDEEVEGHINLYYLMLVLQQGDVISDGLAKEIDQSEINASFAHWLNNRYR